jgi:hypothetical protein
MQIPKNQIKDFVMLPRKIRDDYLEGKLTKNEFDVLIWIWLNTNPSNGYFTADYKALEREFQNRIKYDNMRKIISSLRQKQYIYFPNHRGKKGSFPIYPIGFILKNRQIQTLEYLESKLSITTLSQSDTQTKAQLENNFKGQNHNFKKQKEALIKRLSMGSQTSQITTPYTDNDTENNNVIDKDKFLQRAKIDYSYKKEIPINTFIPKTYEEQRCSEIAKALGEEDLRYLLSRLRKYGINPIEKAWGIYKEDVNKSKIKNPRAYFNTLLEKQIELMKIHKK